nr:ribonuclease H-like domain-containing protein [Tanacetum cinerariifolium]
MDSEPTAGLWDAKWTKIDFIIRSWIFSTLAPSLRKHLVDLNPTTAKYAWTYIVGIFQDNKRPCAMALKAKLHNLKLRDLSIDGYFQKIEYIVLVLNGLGSPLSNNDVVTFALEGLPSTYEMISIVMGSYRFGDACNYFHNGVHGKSTFLPRTSGSASSVPDVTCSDLDILQSLLAKFGLNAPNTSTPSPPVTYTVSVPPGFPSVSAQLSAQPTYVSLQLLLGSFGGVQYGNGWVIPTGDLVSDGVTAAGGLLSTSGGIQQQHGGSFPGSVHLGQSPSMSFHQINMCIYPSVVVGNGRFILVTNSGHSVLSTPFRPLRLKNVLTTPNIVKNLVFVRRFIRDNSCIVEFDPFGFSMKDFITRWVLLCCDSMSDLYPVTKPSTIPHAFLTSQYTWHQRLGHLGSKVLRRLVSGDSISCNKVKLPVLCHACSLFKCEIKSFQCDHGGEFDNHAFHKLFHDNGWNLANISAAEISDLETMLKQKTFTRYEIERLTRLDEGNKANISNDSHVLRLKASTSGPLNKHSEKTKNFHAIISSPRAGKHKHSVLDDPGFGGLMRRTRQKANLLSTPSLISSQPAWEL